MKTFLNDFTAKIKELENLLVNYQTELRHFSCCLDKYNYIVDFGTFTIGTDDDGITFANYNEYPHQFTKKAAEEILDKCSYLNEKYASTGLKLKMYFAKDWYEEKEEQLFNNISFLKEIQNLS